MARKKAVRRAVGVDEVRVEHLIATLKHVDKLLGAVRAVLQDMGPKKIVMAASRKAARPPYAKNKGIVLAGFVKTGGCRQDPSCIHPERVKDVTSGAINRK